MRLLAGKVSLASSSTLVVIIAAELQQEPWSDPCCHRFSRHGVRNGSKVSTIVIVYI